MAKWKIALPSFLLFCISIVLLATSLSTEYWVQSKPFGKADTYNNSFIYDDLNSKKGDINFGLFKGVKRMNMGLASDQVKNIYVVCNSKEGVCMYSDKETKEGREKELENNMVLTTGTNRTEIKNPHLMQHGLWISTLAFVSIALTFSAIGAIFSVVNSVMSPVEFITGIRGLYVWNGCASGFSLCAMIVWSITFKKKLSKNVLDTSYLETGWSSEDTSTLGYSFWLILASLMVLILNITIIMLLTLRPWIKKQPKRNEASNPEGIIMLY